MTNILSEESGQGMVEYGLILVLVSIGVVGILGGIGGGPVKKMYEHASGEVIEALSKN